MHLGAANDGTTRDSYRSDKANLHLCSHTIGGSISSARMLCRRSSSKIAAGFVRAYMRKVPDKKHSNCIALLLDRSRLLPRHLVNNLYFDLA